MLSGGGPRACSNASRRRCTGGPALLALFPLAPLAGHFVLRAPASGSASAAAAGSASAAAAGAAGVVLRRLPSQRVPPASPGRYGRAHRRWMALAGLQIFVFGILLRVPPTALSFRSLKHTKQSISPPKV
jgi:hypothetical protein